MYGNFIHNTGKAGRVYGKRCRYVGKVVVGNCGNFFPDVSNVFSEVKCDL